MMLLWGLTAAAFALWLTLALRTLVRLVARSLADRHGLGPVARLLRDPAFRADRLGLGYSTLALLLLALVFTAAVMLATG